MKFRDIVNKIQMQGSNNLQNASNLVTSAGLSIFSQGFDPQSIRAGGNSQTAGQSGILQSGQSGLNSTSIAAAQEQQIKQMLNQKPLSPPTQCSCITTYCTCLAGRVGMLKGYINQTKIQARQKRELDKALVNYRDDVIAAIMKKTKKVM